MTDTILAANTWATNADLIADVATLYIDPEDLVLDTTYGRGNWWTKFRPRRMITNDLYVEGADCSGDFRDMPWRDHTFDVVAFDPPYVAVGGRKTSTLQDYHDRYGMTNAPTTPAEVQEQIDHGLAEVARVTKKGGLALVKCQDYISSGRYFPGTHRTLDKALDLDFELVDRFEHIAKKARPQPPGRRQLHARRNLSTLFVLRSLS